MATVTQVRGDQHFQAAGPIGGVLLEGRERIGKRARVNRERVLERRPRQPSPGSS